jgi:hypothetical protein
MFFVRRVAIVVRSQISLVRLHSAFDRRVYFLAGHAASVFGRVDVDGRRADVSVRSVDTIAGRDHFFACSHNLLDRCVIFFGRRGERFRRRDPDFRRRAYFFGTCVYFFDADALSIASRTFGGDRRPKTLRKEEKEID